MPRGVSLRHFALLLFGPMLTETLSMFFAAYMMLNATKALGLPPRTQMWIAAVGSTMYAISSFIAGRWVTPRVAPWLMIAAVAGMCVFGLAGAAVGTFAAFLVANGAISACTGHYYTPFQINMTHVRPFRTLAFSVAFYNIAWGTGSAIGPLIGSSLRTAPVWALAIVAGVILALQALVNLLARYAPPPDHEEETHAIFRPGRRRWLVTLTAFFVVGIAARGLYATLVPDLGNQRGWTDFQIGVGQFLLFAPVPILSLVWARLRRLVDRPWMLIGSMIAACAGLLLLPYEESYAAAMVACFAVGVSESCAVFYGIYYTNATENPAQRSRNVGVFEMLVGLSFITGPLVLGLIAGDDARHPAPYLVATALMAGAIAVLVVNHLHMTRAVRRTG